MKKESSNISAQALHRKRPLSPHLSIYRLQLTSGLSILHRITGAYLYFGLLALSWVIFYLVYFPYVLENIFFFITENLFFSIVFKLMLLTWAFSLFYHQLNGIRHLFWDAGKGFDLSMVYITGKLVVVSSILLTIICWALV